MLTINRPYYEYRDIYLFIAVGLAAFITTFIVLGVITTINTNQLSRSTQNNGSTGSVHMTDNKASDNSASKSAGSGTSSDKGKAAPQPGRSDNTSAQSSTKNQQAPALQLPTISSPITTNPTQSYDNTLPPAVIVQQSAQAAPAVPASNTQQQNNMDDDLVNVSLPLGIELNLL